jgi:hypothetical protein
MVLQASLFLQRKDNSYFTDRTRLDPNTAADKGIAALHECHIEKRGDCSTRATATTEGHDYFHKPGKITS